MNFTDKTVESLNYSLEDLNLPGLPTFELHDFDQSHSFSSLSNKFQCAISIVYKELLKYDSTLGEISAQPSIDEVSFSKI